MIHLFNLIINIMKKLLSLSLIILSIGFSSCEKETKIKDSSEIQTKTGDDPTVVDWSMCCSPESCIGEEFIGMQGWAFSVEIHHTYTSQMNISDFYMYIRPSGSGQAFSLVCQAQNNSNPAFFDLGYIMDPGCYDVKIVNSLGDDPVEFCSPTASIDFTFCCGGLIE